MDLGRRESESATGLAFQSRSNFFEHSIEIGPFAVELVDEHDPRHIVLVGLPPDRFALGLDPFAAAEDDDRPIEHAQTAFHFGREIDVARRIEQVDDVRRST